MSKVEMLQKKKKKKKIRKKKVSVLDMRIDT